MAAAAVEEAVEAGTDINSKISRTTVTGKEAGETGEVVRAGATRDMATTTATAAEDMMAVIRREGQQNLVVGREQEFQIIPFFSFLFSFPFLRFPSTSFE
jgi:hypothetical protein